MTKKKKTSRNQDNKGSFSIPFAEKKLVDKEKTQEEMEEGAHFCTHFISLVIALPLPRVYKFLPWSAGACYYPVMTSGQLCEETKSLTSLLPVTGFLDNAPCEKDILKKPLSVKKAAGQEW